MSNYQSTEKMLEKLLKEGLSMWEAEERINTLLTYRYIDSLEPSEQIIRHSIYMDNKASAGVYEAEIMDEEDLFTQGERDLEPPSDIPSYNDLVETVSDLKGTLNDVRDKLNDVLIDKHLYDVVVKHNLKEEDSKDENDGKDE